MSETPTGGQAPPAPPQFSPDGMWWWTGQAWVPAETQPPPPPASPAVPTTTGVAPATGFGPKNVRPIDPAAPANLVESERVLLRERIHPVAAYIWVIVAVGVALLYLLMLSSGGEAGTGFAVALMIMFWVGIPGAVVGYLRVRWSTCTVTTRRVAIKAGVINRRSLETLLTKVESVAVKQGPLGALFGYGTIVVVGTGGTQEPFSGVRNPQNFRLCVQRQIDAPAH